MKNHGIKKIILIYIAVTLCIPVYIGAMKGNNAEIDLDPDSCYAGIPAIFMQHSDNYKTASKEKKLELIRRDMLNASQRLYDAKKEFSTMAEQSLPIEESDLFLKVKMAHFASDQLRARIAESVGTLQEITTLLTQEETRLYSWQHNILERQQQLATIRTNPRSIYLNCIITKRLLEQAQTLFAYSEERICILKELHKKEQDKKKLLFAQYRILRQTLDTLEDRISSTFNEGDSTTQKQCVRFTQVQEQYKARKKQYEEWRQIFKELLYT